MQNRSSADGKPKDATGKPCVSASAPDAGVAEVSGVAPAPNPALPTKSTKEPRWGQRRLSKKRKSVSNSRVSSAPGVERTMGATEQSTKKNMALATVPALDVSAVTTGVSRFGVAPSDTAAIAKEASSKRPRASLVSWATHDSSRHAGTDTATAAASNVKAMSFARSHVTSPDAAGIVPTALNASSAHLANLDDSGQVGTRTTATGPLESRGNDTVNLTQVAPKSDAHEQISRGLAVSALTPEPLMPTFALSPKTVFSAVLRLGSNPANANNQGSPGAESNVRVKVLPSDPSEATTMTRTGSQRGLSKSSRRQRRPSEETEAITKLREMSMQQPQHGAPTPRVAAPRVLFPVKVLAVLVPAVFITFLTISRLRSKPVVRTERFCISRGCIEHAVTIGLSELAKRANKSIPCEEFGHFICSVWEARHRKRYGRRHLTKSVVTDAIMDHIISLEKFSGQQHALIISERPARMMDACLQRRPSDDTEVLKQLLYFMRNTGFGFPTDSVALGDYSMPLKALTELAYKWALPLWFYVDLVRPHNGTMAKRIVSLSHSALGDIYDAFNDALMEYQDIYPLYASILTETVYNGSIGESFQVFTRECKSMQKHVFSNLSRVARRRLHHPILVKVKSLPSFVVNTSLSHWLQALRPLWSVSPSISGKDAMYFTDREVLVAINTLFKAYTARDIYLHVHWWFVQFLGAVASNELFDSLRRDAEHGLGLQKILCSVHVTFNYNFILASEQGARLGPWKRAEVGTHLNNVHAVAVSKVSSAVSVQLANLLEHMKPVIWPREPYASEDDLVRLFGNATSGDEDASFVELWLARAASYQRSRASLDELSADATVFRLDSVAAVSHNVVANAVSLSLAVLKAPFYYPEATSAIVYGGLGFIYATELVRLLNSLSLLLNNRDTIVSSETFSQSYVWLSFACLGMSTEELFPFYMALELAYSTYRKHRSDAEDIRIANANGFSPEQVFFATACYLMCDMGNGAKLCDVFMKSFPEFGTAFSCPPMYRYSSCDILH